MGDRTYTVQEGVAVEVPSGEKLDPLAFSLGPRVTVGQWGEEPEDDHGQGKEQNGTESVKDDLVLDERDPGCREVKDLAECNNGKVQGWEIMMQEELTLHKIEGEIVKSPSKNRGSNLIVETLENGVGVIVAAALPAENGDALEKDVDNHGSSSAPPDDGVTQQVNLAVMPAPEVDTAAKDRPSLGARIPGMGLDEAGIGLPHDLLKLPELAKEAGVAIVDLFSVGSELGVVVRLDIPKTVGKGTALGAGNFLLFRGPIRKFNLMGEKNTARHDVHQLELGVNGTKTFLSNAALRLLLDNLDTEKVIGVSVKALITISGNLVLPVSLSNGGTNIMRMETTVGWQMIETENHAVLNIRKFGEVVPRASSVDRLTIDTQRLGLVFEEPDVVVILVGIEGNLLLLGAGRIHQGVRMQIASLGVDVPDGNTAAQKDVSRHILHALGVQSRLELRAHEAITFARVGEAQEVDTKHGHVEGKRDDNQAESAGHEVLGERTRGDMLVVAKHNPELNQSQAANPGNGEQTNPLDASGNSQAKTGDGQPEPPAWREGLRRSKFLLVGERSEAEGSESGSNHEGRVEQDEPGLGKKAVLCDEPVC